MASLKLAIFGQAPFGKDVTEGLAAAGHDIVGVYAPPEGARPDPLAELAQARSWPLFRRKRFRKQGAAIPELVDEYLALGAELNVMPFTTVILPAEIVDAPKHGSLCFHPSKLPAFRGGSAIAWQIILGANETAATVFRPDEGVDTGPIVVQKAGIPIAPSDNAVSLYFDKLYPVGVAAMLEAVAAVANGSARFTPQVETGASHEPLLGDEHSRLDWQQPAEVVDRLVRGCDPNPGAWAELGGVPVRLFGASLSADPSSTAPGAAAPGEVLGLDAEGRLRIALHGGVLSIAKLRVGDAKKGSAAEAVAQHGLEAGTQLA